jgi:hypothetical protein
MLGFSLSVLPSKIQASSYSDCSYGCDASGNNCSSNFSCHGEGGPYSGNVSVTLNGANYVVNVGGSGADLQWVVSAAWNAIANGGYYACSNGASTISIVSGPPKQPPVTPTTPVTPPPPPPSPPSLPPPPPRCPVLNFCGNAHHLYRQNRDCTDSLVQACETGCNSSTNACNAVCPLSQQCIGNNVYQTNKNCSISLAQKCQFGCSNSTCVSSTCSDGSARPTSGICPGGINGGTPIGGGGKCVAGSACVSTPNACGMVNGTIACPSNTCIPPSDSLCKNTQCLGPDNVTINNGDTRGYFPTASCSGPSQNRACINGVLQGTATIGSCPLIDTSKTPIISAFRITPPFVDKGSSCVVEWAAQNVANCTLTGQGIPGNGINADVPSGSLKTPPIQTNSNYTLTCTNAFGSTSKTGQCNLNPSVKEI